MQSLTGTNQLFDLSTQGAVGSTALVQIGSPLIRQFLQDRADNLFNFLPLLRIFHGGLSSFVSSGRPLPHSTPVWRSNEKCLVTRPLLRWSVLQKSEVQRCGSVVHPALPDGSGLHPMQPHPLFTPASYPI